MKRLVLLWVLLSVLCAAVPVVAEDFPLRGKYPQVQPISLETLASEYDRTLIVDVRSKMEFDVVHIAKAEHVQVTKGNFLSELEKVRSKDADESIAFYCNGHSCAKSYKAATKAMDAGFANIYCFDAGVFDWVNAQPERGSLLGQTPVDQAKLIGKEKLAAKKLTWSDFMSKASGTNAVVIDTRDPFQRAKGSDLPQNKALQLKGVRSIPMDRLVALLKKGEFKNKQLLIFDAVGKQVRWLQYSLEEYGYANYAFLDGGVLAAAESGGTK